MKVYYNIYDYITYRGWSVSKFAKMCDISPSEMSKILRCRVDPRKSVIDKILAVTHMDYHYCFYQKEIDSSADLKKDYLDELPFY